MSQLTSLDVLVALANILGHNDGSLDKLQVHNIAKYHRMSVEVFHPKQSWTSQSQIA